MVKREPPGEVGEDGPSIFIDREQKVASRVDSYTTNIAAVGEGKSVGLVASNVSSSSTSGENVKGVLYLVRSKTVTRLPTGDSKQVPAGSKTRLPLQYTVPRRFENCTLWMLELHAL